MDFPARPRARGGRASATGRATRYANVRITIIRKNNQRKQLLFILNPYILLKWNNLAKRPPVRCPTSPNAVAGVFILRQTKQLAPPEQVRTTEEQVIKRILDYCSVCPNQSQLQELSKMSGRKAFVEKYLKPLLASGKLVMTVPDKPNSRNQKYVKPRT